MAGHWTDSVSAAEKAGLAGWLEGTGKGREYCSTGDWRDITQTWGVVCLYWTVDSGLWTVEWLSGDVSCQRCLDLIETNLSMIYIIIVVLKQSGRHHANSGNVS